MIVDYEVYYHGAAAPLAGRVFGVDELAALCRAAGEDKAVIMPTPSAVPRNREVAEALDASAGSRGLFVGCALINPLLDGAVGELERAVKEWGFGAVKLMPVLHGFKVVGPAAHAVMRKARELQLPVTIHADPSVAHPLSIGVLAEAFPEVPVVMDHMGYRSHVPEAIAAAKRAPNVYLMTTTVMEPHVIREAVHDVGADRVVFGSNGPAVRPETQLLVIQQAELPAAEERKVLGENAARLLRLT